MKHRLFGPSGLRVSELCLGTMTFGDDWGWGAGRKACKAMFDAFTDAGGDFIDTANMYTNGTSEKIVGELLAGDRDRYTLATKYTLSTDPDDPNASGNARKNMMRALDASLERLGTDHADVYWVHAWDHVTPVEEVMRGLDDLVSAGKVHYTGISDAPAWWIARANAVAEAKGWTPFSAMQMQYNLAERSIEREHLPLARHDGLAMTAWGTLAKGVLTGKYLKEPPAQGKDGAMKDGRRLDVSDTPVDPRAAEIAKTVVALADELQVPASQVATNWVRQQDGNVIPILGGTKRAQVEETLGALDWHLKPEELALLDEASQIDLGFPYTFTGSRRIQKMIFGRHPESLEADRPGATLPQLRNGYGQAHRPD